MRKLLAILMALALLCGCAAAESGTETGLQQDVLVLFTSDVHCGVDQNFTYTGLKAVRDAAEAAGNHVLLVDNGDNIQGEAIGIMSRGQISIELMNAMGYDFAIPGNHEFDYSADRFMELAAMAEFPYISCNFRHNGERVFPAYLIREFDGVKIGFVGATTPESLTSSTPKYFQDDEGNFVYDFCQTEDGRFFYETVQKAVDEARAEGAQYVVLMGHLGNEASAMPYTYADVLEHTTGINAMLDGHSHDTERVTMKNKNGEAVIRQACGTKMAGIGWMRISASDGSVDTGLYTWNNSVTAPELLGIENEMTVPVAEKVGEITRELSEVVGQTAVELTINDPNAKDQSGTPVRIARRAETNLGDLCADAFRAYYGTDIGLVNGGGLRKGIQSGDITKKMMLDVYPFGNKIIFAEATGQQILNALEWGARAVPEEFGGFLQVSGLTYEIHTYIESSCTKDNDGMFTGVAGEYRVKNVKIGGEPLDLNKTYTVATQNNVITTHGDGHTAFDGAKITAASEEDDYQVVLKYVQDNLGGVIGEEYANPYGQERIIAVSTAE